LQFFPFPKIALYSCFLLLAGCENSLSFKIVDSKTLNPIPSVQAIVDTECMSYGGYVDEVRPGGCTLLDGKITVSHIRSDLAWRTSVLFYRSGYHDADFRSERGLLTVFERVADGTQSGRSAEKDSDGVILIKMDASNLNDMDAETLKGWTDNPHALRGEIKRGSN
jgi:hypothetical protein